ncbi:hypothetical protein GCM10027048_28000 [Hymenobacter coalescens]
MKFLERNLEDILCSNPHGCYNAGFEAYFDYATGCEVQLIRQPQFEPYGIGDILMITHAPRDMRRVTVRIIECKRGIIGLAAYAQAKRYLTAAKVALASFVAECVAVGREVEWKCVLVGSHVDTYGDFLHVLNNDADCEAYAYTRVGEGVYFERAGLDYLKHGNTLPSALAVLSNRAALGAKQAEAEAARIDAEMELEFPQAYWDNLLGRNG